jgi:hypothetical protein
VAWPNSFAPTGEHKFIYYAQGKMMIKKSIVPRRLLAPKRKLERISNLKLSYHFSQRWNSVIQY